jgi:hypothetical protein
MKVLVVHEIRPSISVLIRSCDGLSSTYNTRVGRSTITGPYVDSDGVPMTNGGGTLVWGTHGFVSDFTFGIRVLDR